jgi:hypothetical protein
MNETAPKQLSWIQRFFVAIFPRSWAESMEADSRRWMMRCRCGFARSIWDLGGIRWKATGNPRQYRRCPQCGQRSWHIISRDPPNSVHDRASDQES